MKYQNLEAEELLKTYNVLIRLFVSNIRDFNVGTHLIMSYFHILLIMILLACITLLLYSSMGRNIKPPKLELFGKYLRNIVWLKVEKEEKNILEIGIIILTKLTNTKVSFLQE